MTILLTRNYTSGNVAYASGTSVTLPSDTETALIAQGYGTAVTNGATASSVLGAPDMYVNQGGNIVNNPQTGLGVPLSYQGPLIWPCINLGSLALSSYETNGTAPVAGSINLTEIYVPFIQTWTGIGVLNGTTVGTDNHLVCLYGSNDTAASGSASLTLGRLLANSAVAGTVSAGASVFQNRAFTSPITLAPGRYFLGVQSNGTTATLRHLVTANGSNVCTSVTAGTFGTIPSTITVPTTFTTAVGVIAQLYV